jgi:WD40 repeat protein
VCQSGLSHTIKEKEFIMWRLVLLGTLLMLSVMVLPAHASHTSPCPYENAAYYRPNLVPHIDHLELSLRDSTTEATITVLDTHILTVNSLNQLVTPYLRWSENCRYLFVFNQYRDDAEQYTRYLGIYDTIEPRQIGLWRGRDWPTFSFDFSPDGNTFFMRSNIDGSFLMGDGWQAPVKIADVYHNRDSQTSWRDWDMERREFLVAFRISPHQVHIFDIDTANLKQVVSQPEICETGLSHQRINENRFLLIYPSFTSNATACINIVNRETGADTIINAGERSTYEPDLIALSPDGRYLVIGLAAISIWDLSALPADLADRQPIYRHEGPISLIGSIHFIDNDTVETTSADGVQRWNIITGLIE